jgi:hypothetical protein
MSIDHAAKYQYTYNCCSLAYQSSAEIGSSKNHDELPWPVLKPFSPGNLKKTAENLMREWEKSLTPPPDDREDPIAGQQQHSREVVTDKEMVGLL